MHVAAKLTIFPGEISLQEKYLLSLPIFTKKRRLVETWWDRRTLALPGRRTHVQETKMNNKPSNIRIYLGFSPRIPVTAEESQGVLRIPATIPLLT
jgi:hypothetical protein